MIAIVILHLETSIPTEFLTVLRKQTTNKRQLNDKYLGRDYGL